jgi:hypothetical protein
MLRAIEGEKRGQREEKRRDDYSPDMVHPDYR